jgi:hypothetical protein
VSGWSCRGDTPAEQATTRTIGATIELDGRNHGIAFAKNGTVWGAAWLRKSGRQSRMHIGDTCFEEVYFTLFNDKLELALAQPVRAMKRRECVPGTKVEIVATPKGFAVSPSDLGARFDLASKRFESGSSFPTLAPAAPRLNDPPQRLYGTEVLKCSLDGSAVIRTWVSQGVPRETGAAQLRYDFSPDGSRITRQGTLMEIAQDSTAFLKTYLLRTGETVTSFVVLKNRIWSQQFGAGGEPRGKLELLVEETDAAADQTQFPQDGNMIHNVTVSTLAGKCVILYTRGNGGLKVYSCKTGKKRSLGEAYFPSIFCADERCVISESGLKIRFLAL